MGRTGDNEDTSIEVDVIVTEALTEAKRYGIMFTNDTYNSQMCIMSDERIAMLAQIASWYYEHELTQEEIARRIGKSRSMVSRLLREARRQGIVEVRIRYPSLHTDEDLAAQLARTFNLQRAWILAHPPPDHVLLLSQLGQLAARCLRNHLQDGVCIGLGWGTAVHAVVRSLDEHPLDNATVVQIIGALGYGDPLVDGPELARWLAQKLNASYRFLHAPLLVESEEVAQALLHERTIAQTLDLARQADIAIVGIGTVTPVLSSLKRAGYLTDQDLDDLRARGVVGDIVARQLDRTGRVLDIPFNRRVIGISVEDLQRIPLVLAVAGGVAKAPAILAALRSGILNAIVTDADTARLVLTLNERQETHTSTPGESVHDR